MKYIEESIRAYEILMCYKYNILVGNSKRKHKISIDFKEDNYWHLAGFGSIRDIPQFKKSKSILYNNLKDKDNKIITLLSNHTIFNNPKYIKRREKLAALEKLLDSKHFIVRVNKFIQGSEIVANFIISSRIGDDILYLFLKSNSIRMGELPKYIDKYEPISFFSECKKNYNLGQLDQHLFYKEKICKKTNKKEIQVSREDLLLTDIDFNFK